MASGPFVYRQQSGHINQQRQQQLITSIRNNLPLLTESPNMIHKEQDAMTDDSLAQNDLIGDGIFIENPQAKIDKENLMMARLSRQKGWRMCTICHVICHVFSNCRAKTRIGSLIV